MAKLRRVRLCIRLRARHSRPHDSSVFNEMVPLQRGIFRRFAEHEPLRICGYEAERGQWEIHPAEPIADVVGVEEGEGEF